MASQEEKKKEKVGARPAEIDRAGCLRRAGCLGALVSSRRSTGQTDRRRGRDTTGTQRRACAVRLLPDAPRVSRGAGACVSRRTPKTRPERAWTGLAGATSATVWAAGSVVACWHDLVVVWQQSQSCVGRNTAATSGGAKHRGTAWATASQYSAAATLRVAADIARRSHPHRQGPAPASPACHERHRRCRQSDKPSVANRRAHQCVSLYVRHGGDPIRASEEKPDVGQGRVGREEWRERWP